jgi:hypothetical protein
MATGNILAEGNIDKVVIVTRAIDISSLAANTTTDYSFTLPSARIGDFVMVNLQSTTAGVGIVNARISAAGFVTLQFVNATAAPVDPATSTALVMLIRSDAVLAGTGW